MYKEGVKTPLQLTPLWRVNIGSIPILHMYFWTPLWGLKRGVNIGINTHTKCRPQVKTPIWGSKAI